MPIYLYHKHDKITFPDGWEEVSTRQYCKIDKLRLATLEEIASFFAGKKVESSILISQALSWVNEHVPLNKGITYPTDLGQESYGQVEIIKSLLLEQPLHNCFGKIYATMQGRQNFAGQSVFDQEKAAKRSAACLDWPITATYPAVVHCLNELKRLNETFAALSEPDETDIGQKARQAGSERLAVFSHMNVAFAYAREFGLSLDETYQIPWQTIMTWLLREKISNEISDNIRRSEH